MLRRGVLPTSIVRHFAAVTEQRRRAREAPRELPEHLRERRNPADRQEKQEDEARQPRSEQGKWRDEETPEVDDGGRDRMPHSHALALLAAVPRGERRAG